MATTTNFGWETPDDTDLVKDGAAAMRTLGNSIDASFVDLKGGTTGQVLSKNSNTDLDFTWVTSDDANAIQNAIVDAKGDLIAASAADTPARLAVGNNGETLVADSSTSTGLRYNPQNALANPFINGAQDVWQRGTSFTPTAATLTYTSDRFEVYRASANYTISRQTVSDSTNLPNIQFALRSQRNSSNAATDIIYLSQSVETVNAIPFAGKVVTLSFYARAGANFSAASSLINVDLRTGTGTDQNVNGGYTGQATPISTTATLTTSWQRFAFTGTIASTVTEFAFYSYWTPVGTAGANDWVEITGIQLDIGTYTASSAPTFRRSGGTLAGELAACQRYYWRSTSNSNYAPLGWGFAETTTTIDTFVKLPVTMRVVPTSIDYSGLEAANYGVSATSVTATITTSQSSPDQALVSCVGSGFTVARMYGIRTNNAANSYLGFSAEL